ECFTFCNRPSCMTSCASFGTPLRLIAERHCWGCDRCRQFPAQPAPPLRPRSPAGPVGPAFVVVVGSLTASGIATRDQSAGTRPHDGGTAAIPVPRDSSPPKPPENTTTFAKPSDEYLARYAAAADKMCACSTVDCAMQARLEFGRWVMAWADNN